MSLWHWSLVNCLSCVRLDVDGAGCRLAELIFTLPESILYSVDNLAAFLRVSRAGQSRALSISVTLLVC